jgi:hypothetical protein
VDRGRESRYPSAVTGESRSEHGEDRAGADRGVPRLPRGRGLKLSRIELLRIAGLAIFLAFLVTSQRPCANAVSTFVTSFGDGSASSAGPRPGAPAGAAGSGAPAPSGSGAGGYERLRPGMTDAEVKAAIERARTRAGSASAPP